MIWHGETPLAGDTAFVQGGYDAFLRRDARNLLGPIERSGPDRRGRRGHPALPSPDPIVVLHNHKREWCEVQWLYCPRVGPEWISLHGTDAYGWGGAGGSILWFNPP